MLPVAFQNTATSGAQLKHLLFRRAMPTMCIHPAFSLSVFHTIRCISDMQTSPFGWCVLLVLECG